MSVVVMGLVWYSTVEGPSNRHVLLAMADRADDEGICWMGYNNLHRKTGISRRQVIRIVQGLEEGQWIVKDNERFTADGDQDTNLYQIDVDKLRASQQDGRPDEDEARAEKLARIAAAKNRRSSGGDTTTPPPESDTPTGGDTTTPPPDEMSPGWCRGVTTGGGAMSPNTSFNPSGNRGEGETAEPDGHAGEQVPDPTAPHPPAGSQGNDDLQKSHWTEPEYLWLCAGHRAAVLADPEADIPNCWKCKRTRESNAQRKAAHERAAAEQVGRVNACQMCAPRTDGDTTKPRPRLDFAGAVLSPWTECDHRTPLGDVLAELRAAAQADDAAEEARRAAPAAGPGGASEEVRAAALAKARAACRPTASTPPRKRFGRSREFVQDGSESGQPAVSGQPVDDSTAAVAVSA